MELLLNVLLFCDFSRWEQSQLRIFIDLLKRIIDTSSISQNPILLSYNPILSICLCCEFLIKIGKNVKIFDLECKKNAGKLMELGHKIIESFDDDKIDPIMNDTDFKDRTLLKIISQGGFEPLFKDDKVNVLLNQIWEGKRSQECDGQTTDFSIINYLFSAPIKKLPGKELTASQLLSNNFEANVTTEKFWFQYKYRHFSISYIFIKDIVSAIDVGVPVYQL